MKFSTALGSLRNDLVVGFEVNQIKLTYSHDFGSDVHEDFVDPFTFNPGLFLDTQGIKTVVCKSSRRRAGNFARNRQAKMSRNIH